MIAEFIHRSDVENYQQKAQQKVKLLERIHQLNAIIVYKLEQLNLKKKKVTYKKKTYVPSAIQFGAKGISIAFGSSIIIRCSLALAQVISAYLEVSTQTIAVIAEASSIVSSISAWIAGVGAIIFVASQIYGGWKWCQLKKKIQKQVTDLDANISREIDYFNEIAAQIYIEGQPFGIANIETIKDKQTQLLKQL